MTPSDGTCSVLFMETTATTAPAEAAPVTLATLAAYFVAFLLPGATPAANIEAFVASVIIGADGVGYITPAAGRHGRNVNGDIIVTLKVSAEYVIPVAVYAASIGVAGELSAN